MNQKGNESASVAQINRGKKLLKDELQIADELDLLFVLCFLINGVEALLHSDVWMHPN